MRESLSMNAATNPPTSSTDARQVSDALYYLCASEVLRLFKEKRLSPVELLNALIGRAEQTEPAINAFASTYFEQALVSARQAEAAYTKGKTAAIRPLEGIPVALKNEHSCVGHNTTQGSTLLKDHVDSVNAPITLGATNQAYLMPIR